jgi:hypothetical protein
MILLILIRLYKLRICLWILTKRGLTVKRRVIRHLIKSRIKLLSGLICEIDPQRTTVKGYIVHGLNGNHGFRLGGKRNESKSP